MQARSRRQSDPPRWLPALRSPHWRGRVAGALCFLLLFALAAPGISGWFHAAHAEHQATPELCAEHREHLPEGACDAPSTHADHGVHCGFCLLFSHVPVVAGAGLPTSLSLSLHTAAPPAIRCANDICDRAAAWMRRHKHEPPSFG